MKINHTTAIESPSAGFMSQLQLQILFVVTILILGFTKINAQVEEYTKPSWMFGVATGANFNFYRGSTFMLNENFTPPTAFHKGNGVGLFIAPTIEYHKPDSRFGFIFQAGYDSRRGSFDQVTTPCNCPADLKTKLSYITIEPSLRFTPFRSNLYLYGGPRFAFLQDKSFTYEQGTNPDFPLQVQNPDVKGDFSDVNKTIISMQIGLGYDIPLNTTTSKTQFVLSPFIAYHPYFSQNPRGVETWNITTLRAGMVLKFGQGQLIELPIDGEVTFSANPPTNVEYVKVVREVFPIRNYVFFNEGSTEIPNRYVILNKNEVKDFKEDQVQFNTPKNMSGRSERQMLVYYNILNILGDRMVKNPNTTVTLVGSSENGRQEGLIMAQNIKNYLTTVFEIKENRIAVEGRDKPLVPSEQIGGTKELGLLKEGDRRVTIESNSPELLIEFQSGKNAPLKPIEIIIGNENPSNDVVFDVKGTEEALKFWSLQIIDEKGKVQNFGPYAEEQVNIPRKTIMGNQPENDYKIIMTGTTKSGKIINQESTMHLTPYVAPVVQESIRFSVIYEFNESKSIAIYDKYLTEIVAPKIPQNATVIITGHTDIIGEIDYNKNLSLARVNDVRSILEKSLATAGRTDVTFKVRGEGEDEKLAPFDNKYPEERFYNRTVIIDIVK
ncbi:OmpA family protein [Flavobacterium sp. HNIBRBA15423]|uniref:OmpA family protein n=1 Tax=Flavobacterium sp. HNIBRBA15423 TaxID=3458683 RepID=UPI0040449741